MSDFEDEANESDDEGGGMAALEGGDADGAGYTLADFENLIEHHGSEGGADAAADPPTAGELWGVLDEIGQTWLDYSNPNQLASAMHRLGLEFSESNDTVYTSGGTTLRGMEAIEAAFLRKHGVLFYLHMLAANSGMLRSEDHKLADPQRDKLFCRTYEAMQQCFVMLRAEYRLRSQQVDTLYEDQGSSSSMLLTQQTLDFTVLDKASPMQWCILYCLQESFRQGLRKKDNLLFAQVTIPRYERVVDESGQPVCARCGDPASKHPTTLRGRRSHAFETQVREAEGAAPIRTHAWQSIHQHDSYRGKLSESTIAAWLQLRCSKDGPGGIEAWYQLTKTSAHAVAEQLQMGYDNELPRLRVDRLKWAFFNGVFDGDTCCFYEWGTEQAIGDFVATRYMPIWFDEDAIAADMRGAPIDDPLRPECARFSNFIPNRRCATCGTLEDRHRHACEEDDFVPVCVVCDAEEDDCDCEEFNQWKLGDDSWERIRTPIFDSILRYQRLAENPEEEAEVWKWVCIYLGRLFHPISSDKEDWQVCLLIKGQASTGKSTLGEWVMQWFLQGQVGLLSNNAQEQFGLETIVNADGTQKQLVVCLETKGDFKLSQTELQSIITGESVSVIRKGIRPIDIEHWEAPIFLLGNEIPGIDPGNAFRSGYKDNSGSLSRRFIILEFTRELMEELKDSELKRRLLYREGAALLAKCLLAYKRARDRFGAVSTWGKDPVTRQQIMPACFHGARTKMRLMTNSLEAFLHNPTTAEDALAFRADAYISSQDFIQMWRAKCNELAFATNTRFTEDLYCGPFARYKLRVVRDRLVYPPLTGQPRRNEYVVGIGRATLFPSESASAGARAAATCHSADSGGGTASAGKSWWVGVTALAEDVAGPLEPAAINEFARIHFERDGSLRGLSDEHLEKFVAEWQRRQEGEGESGGDSEGEDFEGEDSSTGFGFD